MELEVLVRIIRRWWMLIVVGLLVGGVAGFGFAEARTPIYQSSVELLVGPLSADSGVLRAAGQTAQTYAELASARSTLDAVVSDATADLSRLEVTATASDVTRILKVRVRDANAALSASIANGIADELEAISNVTGLGGATTEADITAAQVGELRILEAATPPLSPISPNKQLIVGLGASAMMIAVALGVITYEYTRNTVRVLSDVVRVVPGDVYGRVEHSWQPFEGFSGRIAVLHNENGDAAVSLRALGIDLSSHLADVGGGAGIVISGTNDHDRSGDVAVNVAAALAGEGRRIALIDANDTTREIRTWLSSACEIRPGRFDVEINEHARIIYQGAHTDVEDGTLDLYLSDMQRLPLKSELEAALMMVDDVYDLVVVHTAPSFGSLAAVRWASSAAGSVLVATTELSSARAVERCALTLSRGSKHFIGAVFDGRPALQRPVFAVRRITRRTPRDRGAGQQVVKLGAEGPTTLRGHPVPQETVQGSA